MSTHFQDEEKPIILSILVLLNSLSIPEEFKVTDQFYSTLNEAIISVLIG
jgi:hypothetical protein